MVTTIARGVLVETCRRQLILEHQVIPIRGGGRAGRRRPDWPIYFVGDPEIDGRHRGRLAKSDCMTRSRVAKVEHAEARACVRIVGA